MRTKLLITRREAGLMLAGLAAAFPARAKPQPVPSSIPRASRNFRAAPVKAALRPGGSEETVIWSLDGSAAGPFLTASVGEECVIPVENSVGLPLSLHWHGARIDNAMDGAGGLTQEPIPPGGSFTYRFRPQEPGLWLIRPCVIGGTSELVGRGLTGLFLVQEETGQRIADMGMPLVIDDWLLDQTAQLEPFRRTARGRLGNILTVNGKQAPLDLGAIIEEAGRAISADWGSRVRLYIANASNARSFRLRFDNMKAYVVAVDGQPTEAFEPLRSSLPFSPGNRYDIVIDLPQDGPDAAITALLGQELPLVTCRPRARSPLASGEVQAPQPNPRLPQTIRLQNALRVDIPISAIFGKRKDGTPDQTAPAGWSLGKISGPPRTDKPLFSVKSGRPVVLAISNGAPIAQPVHVHGHCFRLLHPFDDGWDPFWMDTLLIPANTTVRIAFIAGTPGRWLIASTVCEHFDTGLWGWFEVV